jgi:hypothetical protein
MGKIGCLWTPFCIEEQSINWMAHVTIVPLPGMVRGHLPVRNPVFPTGGGNFSIERNEVIKQVSKNLRIEIASRKSFPRGDFDLILR